MEIKENELLIKIELMGKKRHWKLSTKNFKPNLTTRFQISMSIDGMRLKKTRLSLSPSTPLSSPLSSSSIEINLAT